MSTRISFISVCAAVFVFCVSLFAFTDEGQKVELKTDVDKLCYTLGVNVAKTFELIGQEPNLEVFVRAMKDVFEKKNLAMTDEEMQNSIRAFQQSLMTAQMKKREEEAAKNEEAAKKFLEENKTKEGVITHPSGIQYKVLREGNGPKPKETDTVKVHYKGSLIDGTVFDSSYDRGEPATLPLNRVIKGWSEAVQLMPVGSKWQVFIPPELAYGKEGNQAIPPNSLLIFEVELLGIENQEGSDGDTVELPKQ